MLNLQQNNDFISVDSTRKNGAKNKLNLSNVIINNKELSHSETTFYSIIFGITSVALTKK